MVAAHRVEFEHPVQDRSLQENEQSDLKVIKMFIKYER